MYNMEQLLVNRQQPQQGTSMTQPGYGTSSATMQGAGNFGGFPKNPIEMPQAAPQAAPAPPQQGAPAQPTGAGMFPDVTQQPAQPGQSRGMQPSNGLVTLLRNLRSGGRPGMQQAAPQSPQQAPSQY